MSRRSVILAAMLLAVALPIAAWVPAAVRADTCCSTADVSVDPPIATAGEVVALDGISCTAADGGASWPLAALRGFWLTTETPDAFLEDPDRPDAASWPAFDAIDFPDALVGSAAIVVPGLPDGSYAVWWSCADPDATSAASYVLHRSTGDRLRIGPPDTAAENPAPRSEPGPPVIPVLAAAGALLVLLRRARPRQGW